MLPVGAGVEVQQVFADDEHLRARVRAVVAHARHDVDGLLEAIERRRARRFRACRS